MKEQDEIKIIFVINGKKYLVDLGIACVIDPTFGDAYQHCAYAELIRDDLEMNLVFMEQEDYKMLSDWCYDYIQDEYNLKLKKYLESDEFKRSDGYKQWKKEKEAEDYANMQSRVDNERASSLRDAFEGDYNTYWESQGQ